MGKLYISKHPLIEHKLSILRDKDTKPSDFHTYVVELGQLLCYEATQDLVLNKVEITTPMQKTEAYHMAEHIALVPILRAGLGLLDGVWSLIPTAHVFHLGFYRDEDTLRPVEYYNKLPNGHAFTTCLVLDPMLATGGSAVAAVDILKRWGAKRIKFVGLIGAPEGVEKLSHEHPDVDIHLAALDEKLNDKGYILPGLGDAGDRIFGTIF